MVNAIDITKFNDLLANGEKDQALAMLKDPSGSGYLNEVKIGSLPCKIFLSAPDELFSEKTSILLPKIGGSYPEFYTAIIIGNVTFKDREVSRSEFGHWYFLGDLDFSGSTFINDAIFLHTVFYGNVNFCGCIFNFKAKLGAAKFCTKALFEHTKFSAETNFKNCSFQGKSIFYNSKFAKESCFSRSEFSEEALFTDASFYSVCSFQKAIFHRDSKFRTTLFHNEVKFRDVEFNNACADFYEARFYGYVDFHGIQFKEESDADYTHAKFYDNVTFADAIFNNNLFLRNTIFEKRCEFRGAQLGNYIDLIGTDFRGSVFMDPKKLYKETKAEPQKLIAKGGMIYTNEIIEDITEDKLNVLIGRELFKKVKTNANYVQFNYSQKAKQLCSYIEEIFDLNDKELSNKIVQYTKKTQEHNQINIHAAKQLCNKMGYYDSEDYFWYWYKASEQKLKPLWRRFLSCLFLGKMTGYFTRPVNVFFSMIGTILVFGILYCFPCGSIKESGNILWSNYEFSFNSIDNICYFFKIIFDNLFSNNFWHSLYFSAITFATIGYGDYQPASIMAKVFAAFEGIFGVLLMSTFLVTLTRKHLR